MLDLPEETFHIATTDKSGVIKTNHQDSEVSSKTHGI